MGVAPSLAVVYIVGGWLRGLWSGGRGRGKYGGKRGRESSFYAIRSALYFTAVLAILRQSRNVRTSTNAKIPSSLLLLPFRRIERLLTNARDPTTPAPFTATTTESSPTASTQLTKRKTTPLDPLTQGLLLVSLSHLRHYAEHNLPKRSRIREGFLEDLNDLEDPSRGGRDEKVRIVQRMWRSWGDALGWGKMDV